MFNHNYMLNQRESNLRGYISLITARVQGNVYILVLCGESRTLQCLFLFFTDIAVF